MNTNDTISRQGALEAIKFAEPGCEYEAVEVLPSIQPEITEEAVREYCRKRGLTILTNDYFHKLTSAQPKNMCVNLDIQKITKHKSDFSDLDELSSAQPDYTEMKQEFLRMASYIDVLLECSDEQKETLMGFISRLAKYMPWTESEGD